MSEVHRIGTKVRRLPGQALREQFESQWIHKFRRGVILN